MKYEDYPLHNSIRGWFGRELYFQMQSNPNIHCFTADLGYGLLCHIRDDFPNRFMNFGASEQAMIGAAVGMTLSGKTVFCYSITTFLLYRGFEWLRNYVNHENIPVRLVGSGMDDDYKHDGITHQPWEAREVLKLFPKIVARFPEDKVLIPGIVKAMIDIDQPSFLCLRR